MSAYGSVQKWRGGAYAGYLNSAGYINSDDGGVVLPTSTAFVVDSTPPSAIVAPAQEIGTIFRASGFQYADLLIVTINAQITIAPNGIGSATWNEILPPLCVTPQNPVFSERSAMVGTDAPVTTVDISQDGTVLITVDGAEGANLYRVNCTVVLQLEENACF